MNKSEIIAQAAIEQKRIDAGMPYSNTETALIEAARLLEMVEVVEEGEKAQKGDILYKKWTSKYGYSENVFFASTNVDLPETNMESTQIIQRHGKPVITIKKVEA